jgi:hypothetical protein
LILPSLAALSGILGGYQFPIAAEIYLHDRAGRSESPIPPNATAPSQSVTQGESQPGLYNESQSVILSEGRHGDRSRRICGCFCFSPPQLNSSGLGTLYALDLLGGCAGALLLSTYLIPVFGFWKTAWLCAAINLAPALLAVRVGMEEKKMER